VYFKTGGKYDLQNFVLCCEIQGFQGGGVDVKIGSDFFFDGCKTAVRILLAFDTMHSGR
jgi:hypothetical protein